MSAAAAQFEPPGGEVGQGDGNSVSGPMMSRMPSAEISFDGKRQCALSYSRPAAVPRDDRNADLSSQLTWGRTSLTRIRGDRLRPLAPLNAFGVAKRRWRDSNLSRSPETHAPAQKALAIAPKLSIGVVAAGAD